MTEGGTPPPAGWYRDPDGSDALRWWDGTAWTEHRQSQMSQAPNYGQASSGSAMQSWAPQPQAERSFLDKLSESAQPNNGPTVTVKHEKSYGCCAWGCSALVVLGIIGVIADALHLT